MFKKGNPYVLSVLFIVGVLIGLGVARLIFGAFGDYSTVESVVTAGLAIVGGFAASFGLQKLRF